MFKRFDKEAFVRAALKKDREELPEERMNRIAEVIRFFSTINNIALGHEPEARIAIEELTEAGSISENTRRLLMKAVYPDGEKTAGN